MIIFNGFSFNFTDFFDIPVEEAIFDDKGILILGATNIPRGLDHAVRKRFQKKIYIILPELDTRKVMFGLNLKGKPNTLTDEQLEDLAARTDGFSGSDILF